MLRGKATVRTPQGKYGATIDLLSASPISQAEARLALYETAEQTLQEALEVAESK